MWVIKDVVKRLVGVISFFVSLWKDKAKARCSFVHPSFILRYFFDSGAENKPWQGDGTVADKRCLFVE
jgi:hypothetical protein